jgi:hypothetical protein
MPLYSDHSQENPLIKSSEFNLWDTLFKFGTKLEPNLPGNDPICQLTASIQEWNASLQHSPAMAFPNE